MAERLREKETFSKQLSGKGNGQITLPRLFGSNDYLRATVPSHLHSLPQLPLTVGEIAFLDEIWHYLMNRRTDNRGYLVRVG
jgi:hypothetical protein